MLSIIIPAYNEGGNIYGNIAETREAILNLGLDFEIVVVDDGSSDNTLSEIERAAADFDDVHATRNIYNMGKGMALRTGFDFSKGDIVAFLDADLDLHPSQIQSLMGVLDAGPWDIVIGSKHHPDSKLDYPAFRKVASWVYYKLIGAMFGLPVRDTQTGLKVFRRTVLESVFHRLMVKKYAYDVELLAAAVRLGYSVHEIPVVLEFRRELKWGRIKLQDIVSIFMDTLAIFYRLRILRYYDAERPPMPQTRKKVLVVIPGCPPAHDVLDRLTVESETSIACISDSETGIRTDIDFFDTMADFNQWQKNECSDYDYIGFLGEGYLPTGSWVKNAVRNFENPDVVAVCGPLIPGPLKTIHGKAAGFAASSRLCSGPNSYLHTIRTMRAVRRCSAENIFLRADCWPESNAAGLTITKGMVDNDGRNGVLLYDPDVAVSKPLPPLPFPYLKTVAREAFLSGRGDRPYGLWQMIFPVLALIIAGGWAYLPATVYYGIVATYALAVVLTGISTFDASISIPVMMGTFLDNTVRSVVYPLGLMARLFGRSKS